MSAFSTSIQATLPDDAERASLAGRVWRPELGGPSVVAIRDGSVVDVSATFPTMRDLCETADPGRRVAIGCCEAIGRAGRVAREHACRFAAIRLGRGCWHRSICRR